MAGDLSFYYAAVNGFTNRIQSLTPSPGKFELGTSGDVNGASDLYHFFALG